MRSYIFTEKERLLIDSFLKGHIRAEDRSFHVLASRIRHFNELARDVDLYLAVRRKLAESKTAKSA